MKFKTNSQKEQLEALKLLQAFGWSNSYDVSPEKYVEFDRYPIVSLGTDKKYTISMSSVSYEHSYSQDLPKIVSYLNGTDVVEVVLNSSYTAKVSEDGIVVGCQTFPLSIAKELYDAVEKIKKNS